MVRKTTDTVQLKLRFSEALRRRLDREAKRQEHSLNGEIIHRLEQSFRKAENADLLGSTLRALFGGATGDLLRAIATVVWLIERRTGKKWNEDRDTASQVSIAMRIVLRAFVLPLEAEGAFRAFKDEEVVFVDGRFKRGEPPWGNVPWGPGELGMGAALEALQKMGMAPSDAEIAEAGEKVQAAQKAEAAKNAKAQEVEKK